MTKLKTHDLIKLRQIDREKFEKVIKGYADYFGDLLKDDERKREIFKKDPNAELICEFISKLFRLTIKSAEKEVLRRWFADAKSKNKDIESLQGIGNDEMKGHLLNLSFWQLNDIIKETEYFGDLDIAEKLLDIEGRTKKAESALASFREGINGRLDKIDKDIAEKLEELKETTVAIEDRTKNTESALELFREEINGRLDEIDKDIAEKLGELKETTVAIEDRTKKAESALASFREEINGRLDKVDSEIKEFKQESQQTFITIRATQYRTAIKSAHAEKDLIELLRDAVVKAAIDGISEAVEEGVKEGVKDLSKISFEQIKKYLLRLSEEELVKLSGEKWKSPEDFVEVPK